MSVPTLDTITVNDEEEPIYKARFKLAVAFARAALSEKKFIQKTLPAIITADNEIMGGIIFEKPSNGKIIMQWY